MVDDDRTLKTGGDTDGGITGAAVVVEIRPRRCSYWPGPHVCGSIE